MREYASHAIVAGVAFAIGLLVALVVVEPPAPTPTPTPGAMPEPTSADGDTRATAKRQERRHTKRVGTNGEPGHGVLTADALGTPVTGVELAFLRRALADERKRAQQAVADAEEQIREAQLQSDDDGLTVLDRYLRRGSDVSDVVSSFAAMRAHVRTEPGPVRRIESTGERTSVDMSKVTAGNAVIEFGEGVFVLDQGSTLWNVQREDLESLEIRGSGMNKTTLIGPGWAFLCANKGARIRNLVISDLTINSLEKEQIVLDARGGISAAIERVRFDGWVVAGHAAALGVTGDAFLALRDCEFKGDGYVLSLRGPGMAVFERCSFSDARSVLIAGSHKKGRAAIVRLNDCDFNTVPIADRNLHSQDEGGADVEIRGGTAAGGPASWTEAQRIKNFGAREVVSMKGLKFVATPPSFSVEDAAIAFDLAAAEGLRNVVGVRVAGRGGKPLELDFYVVGAEPGTAPKRQTRIFDGAALAAPATDPRRGVRANTLIDLSEVQRAQPLSTLLRNSGIAADESVVAVTLRTSPAPQTNDDSEPLRTLMLMIELQGRQQLILNATSGAVLGGR